MQYNSGSSANGQIDEERFKELYEQIKDLNAYRLFSHVCMAIRRKHDMAPRDSSLTMRLKSVLGDLFDQVQYRTRNHDLNGRYTIQDYMQKRFGPCRTGLKALLRAVDEFGVELPEKV